MPSPDSEENKATGPHGESRHESSKANESGEEPMLYCPVCDNRLGQSRCKLVCEKCGYFMSCSDYY